MQIRLTVLGPRGGGPGAATGAGPGAGTGTDAGTSSLTGEVAGLPAAVCDVTVTAPTGTPLAAVTGSLVTAAASCGVGPGTAGGADSVPIYAGGERLDAHRQVLGEPPLLDGAVVSLAGPAQVTAPPSLDGALALLRVVAGPDAGGVHLLRGGEIQIGRSATADVPLDDPDVSRLHCSVTVAGDGQIAVADLGSTNGTSVDGLSVADQPAWLRPGAALRLGESVLRLETDPAGLPRRPQLATAPDQEGHLRIVPGGAPVVEQGEYTGPPGHPAPGSGPGDTTRLGSAPALATPGAPVRRAPGRGEVPGREVPGRGEAPGRSAVSGPGRTAGGDRLPTAPGADRATDWPSRSGHPDSVDPPARGDQARPSTSPGRPMVPAPADGTDAPGSDADWPDRTGGAYPAPDSAGRAYPARTGDSAGPSSRGAMGPGSHGGTELYDVAGQAGHPRPHQGERPAARAHLATDASAESAAPTSHRQTDDRQHNDRRPSHRQPSERNDQQYREQQRGSDQRATERWDDDRRDAEQQRAVPPPPTAAPHHPRSPTGASPSPAPADRGVAPGWPHSGAGSGPEAVQHGRAEGPLPPGGTTHDSGALRSETADSAPVTRRTRGIGAWARRIAGGRSAAAEPGGEPAGESPTADPAWEVRWPDPATVLLTALGPGPRLWERGPGHPDALTVRLGTAQRATGPVIPVTVDLRQAGSLGLAGPRPRLLGLARSVLAQIAALHPPAALELVLISADDAWEGATRRDEWSWAGWLPQLRPTQGQDCRLLLAFDPEQAAARVSELERRLDEALASNEAPGRGSGNIPGQVSGNAPGHGALTGEDRAAGRPAAPVSVVLLDGDPGPAVSPARLARLASQGPAAGIHLLCLAETPPATPASPLASTLAAAQAASPAFAACGEVALLSGSVATALRVLRQGNDHAPSPEATVERTAAAGRPGAPRARAPHPTALTEHTHQAHTFTSSPVSVPTSAPGGPPTADTTATVDAVSAAWAERFARALAPLREAETTGRAGGHPATALPVSCRLLDELGLARATPAALLSRWTADDRDGSGFRPFAGRTNAVLGAGVRGPVTVDPAGADTHLSVTGGKGSGKTELLRSLVASLAAGDRPDRLGLVLVDGAGTVAGEGLRVCGELPHVSTYLTAGDPVRMREFAQALSGELKRRAELLGDRSFEEYARVPRRRETEDAHPGQPAATGRTSHHDVDQRTLHLRSRPITTRTGAVAPALPRLTVLVDDFDTLVAPALGNPGRPAAGSVVRALESVAREGPRLGVHLVVASGRPQATEATAAHQLAGLRVQLGTGDSDDTAVPPGRGVLYGPTGATTAFQAGRVSGRIPRTSTLRPTVVPLDWARAGDPPTRRPVRELGNGPTDLALLASAIERAARSAGATPVSSLT